MKNYNHVNEFNRKILKYFPLRLLRVIKMKINIIQINIVTKSSIKLSESNKK